MIGVQRTQSHPSAAAEMSGRLPIMSRQIVRQRNLLFQLVESLATHGARMVGVRKKCSPGWTEKKAQVNHPETYMWKTALRPTTAAWLLIGRISIASKSSVLPPASVPARVRRPWCRPARVPYRRLTRTATVLGWPSQSMSILHRRVHRHQEPQRP